MKRRLLIALFVMVVAPLVVLGWLGVKVAQNEREVVGHRFRELLRDRLDDIDADIMGILSNWERQLLTEPSLTALEPWELRLKAMQSPIVQQYFILDVKGDLSYPFPSGALNTSEERFVMRTKNIWLNKEISHLIEQDETVFATEKQLVQTAAKTPSKSVPQKAALRKGWHSWYWDNGLNMIFWWMENDGTIVGAEVSGARLMSDIVGILPETFDQDEYLSKNLQSMQQSRIALLDSNGDVIYQWGGYEPKSKEQPQTTQALSPPLGAWKLHYYTSDDRIYGGYGKGMLFNLLSGIGTVAVAMIALAIYFYRESARDMREAMQRINFVNNVSHELKTPLTSIRMYAEMLADKVDEEEPKTKRHLGIIVSESQRLSRLIGNVLTFSRKQRSMLKLHTLEGIIDEALREILERFEKPLATKGIRIVFDANAGNVAAFDRDVMEQVMCNLLSNVEKYAVTADCVKVASLQEGDNVTITFSDNGSGIPESEHKNVFKAFYRVSDKLSDGVAGTGIGLTIAREVARLHGGDLSLERSEKGTCFRFTLRASQKESNE